MFLAGVISADGVIAPMPDEERSRRLRRDGRTWSYVLYEPPSDAGGPTVMVTQNDVRAVQLAKAALRAGIDLLCEHADAAEISSVVLTGAFGSHIDPLRAMVLGMIPDCDPTRVHAATNAAGAGAVRALLSRRERAEMCQTARRVVKVETATQPRFQELFVAAMALPHAEAPTPWLAQAVQLPSPPSDSEQSRLGGVGSRRRRRRRGVSSRQRLQ